MSGELFWTDERKKRFWDYWDFESPCEELYFTYALGEYLVEKFSRYYGNAKNALDFGSGRGYLIDPLIKKNLEVSTIEFSDKAIESLQNKYKNISGFGNGYRNYDFEKIKKKFDLLFLIEVIEHLNDEELQTSFKMIRHLLNKGGQLFITTPHDEILKNSTVFCPECNNTFHRWQHIRSWNKQTLNDFLANNGFEVIMVGETDLNYEKAKLKFSWRQKIADKLTKKDRQLVYQPHLVCVAKLR